MDRFNQLVTPETVMWVSAAAALALLVCLGPVSAIWMSARRDAAMRTMKIAVYLIASLTVIFPALILLTGQTVRGTACGWYLLFFLLFWYYLGRRTGMARGRRDIIDLVGLDTADSIEDAQDRLYESRLRLPGRDAVMESIKRLSREMNAAGDAGGPAAGGEHGTRPDGTVDPVHVNGVAASVQDAPIDNTMRQ